MSVKDFDSLAAHYGHDIECVLYGENISKGADEEPDFDNAANVALECVTCGCVLIDFDQEPVASQISD